jgi:hypothetical protein
MENKYYTPETEEFVLGFEYQLKPSPLMDWENKKVKLDINLEAVDFHIKNNEGTIRVKYLDRDDIIDCKFKYINNKRDLVKDSVRVRTYIGEQFEVPNIVIYKDSSLVFSGKIKNKTEFKKLLTQLGIVL